MPKGIAILSEKQLRNIVSIQLPFVNRNGVTYKTKNEDKFSEYNLVNKKR